MKMLKRLFILLSIMLCMNSCTQNNGDIGHLFGYWRLEKLTVNGIEENLYDGTGVDLYAFAFQSNVMYIQAVYPHLDYDRAFGTWTLDGNEMTWQFNWTDNVTGNINYIAPAALMLNPGITHMNVLRLTSSNLDTEYIDPQGNRICYYLKKTK